MEYITEETLTFKKNNETRGRQLIYKKDVIKPLIGSPMLYVGTKQNQLEFNSNNNERLFTFLECCDIDLNGRTKRTMRTPCKIKTDIKFGAFYNSNNES